MVTVSERRKPSRSTQAGKRGRHKHNTSRETQAWAAWEREHEAAKPPVWMDAATADALTALRRSLDPWVTP